MLVDGFQLMRQRVHAGDGEAEVRVELVGDAERVGLQRKTQPPPVALVGARGVGDGEAGHVLGGERNAQEALRAHADQAHIPTAGAVLAHGLYAHGLGELRAGERLALRDGRQSTISTAAAAARARARAVATSAAQASATPMRRSPRTAGLPNSRSCVSGAAKAAGRLSNAT